MIIPMLHFCDNCKEAIAMYEKAFDTKAENVYCSDDEEKIVDHAEMDIHGQKIFLNDRFGNRDKSLDCAARLIVTFPTAEEVLACYEKMKEGSRIIDPFEEAPYSKFHGNFIDRFGVMWGFMVEA